jgi:hypothetical protein
MVMRRANRKAARPSGYLPGCVTRTRKALTVSAVTGNAALPDKCPVRVLQTDSQTISYPIECKSLMALCAT